MFIRAAVVVKLCSGDERWFFAFWFFFFLGVIMVDFCVDFVANLDGFELWSWRPVVMGGFRLWYNFFWVYGF